MSGSETGTSNQIRPTSLTYPDSRVISYDYGDAPVAGWQAAFKTCVDTCMTTLTLPTGGIIAVPCVCGQLA
jgi:hypothetical protein